MNTSKRAAGICAALLSSISIPAGAAESSDHTAVLGTIQRMFDAMAAHDGKALTAVTLENAPITSETVNADGTATLHHNTSTEFAAMLDKKGPPFWEGIWSPTVHIRGPIAVVWAPYEFKLDGKSHHCGIDVFDLVKADGGWKISNIFYTTEPTACAELKAAHKGG